MTPKSNSPLRTLVCGVLIAVLGACSDSPPTIAALSPNHGPASGGQHVTLTGKGFGSNPIVRLGGQKAKVTSTSDTKLELLTPRVLAGPVAVEVQVDDLHARLDKGFTFDALALHFVDAAWQRILPFPVSGAGVALADGDGDGDLDVFQAARGEGAVVYVNNGSGQFGAPQSVTPGPDALDAVMVVARDFNGDGVPDLFFGTTGKTQSRLLLGAPGLAFSPAPTDALPPLFGSQQTVVAGDLDGDGDVDLVLTGTGNAADEAPHVVLLFNSGTGTFTNLTAERLAGSAFDASGAVVGDVDGDGDVDLFFAGNQAPSRLFLGDGHGAFSRAAPDAIPYEAKPGVGMPALGDLTGDGHPDLFLPTSGQDRIFVNDGTGRFDDLTDVLLGAEAGVGRHAVLADLDLDGHLDVVVVDQPGALRLYRNDGTGRLFDYSAELVGNSAALLSSDVAVGDLDGDGTDDLFVSRSDVARAALFLGGAESAGPDADTDRVPDGLDNCPALPNPDQGNADSLPFRCSSDTKCQAETGCSLHVFQSSAYLYCSAGNATQAAAQAGCAGRGGNLVTINSAEENAFLTAAGLSNVWIGFNDIATEGSFVWTSGDSTYVNWSAAQPDNSAGAENCVALLSTGAWNDDNCAVAKGFICETPRGRAPDPGDACDSCPALYEPGSAPVGVDGGSATCGAP